MPSLVRAEVRRDRQRPVVLTRSTLRALAAAAAFTGLPAHAATITSIWLGGTGSWEDPTQWSAGTPSNTATDSFTALIDANNPVMSQVTLSSPIGVDGLNVSVGDALVVTSSGQLTITGASLQIDGQLMLQGSGGASQSTLVFSAPAATLSGGGTVELANATLTGSSQLALMGQIHGYGSVQASLDSGASVSNYGVIEADVAGQGIGLGGYSFHNYGTLRATNGSTLGLEGGAGGAWNDGGTVEALDGSKVYCNDLGGSTGGTFSALRNSAMFLSGGYGNTTFITDATSSMSIGDGGVTDVTFDGNITFGGDVSGTIINRGVLRGDFIGSSPTTYINSGEIIVDADMENPILRGGGLVILDGSASAVGPYVPRITGPLQNIDNTIHGAGYLSGVVLNGGEIEAQSGTLFVYSNALTHTGVFSAAAGGVLEMAATTVSGTGSWVADGGLIHIAGDIETTGDVQALRGGTLSVDGTMNTANLVVDNTGSLDVNGLLKVAGNLAFDGPNGGRWLFGPSSSVTLTRGTGAAIGDWSGWQRIEAAGRDLGDVAAGFTNSNSFFPELVIGPDGRLALRDQFDNGNRTPGTPEAVYVDTLVFSDALGLVDLNGLHLYYNHLVGSAAQIIDVAVPEPQQISLVGAMLLALAIGVGRKAGTARDVRVDFLTKA
jgi:hypothetical protein